MKKYLIRFAVVAAIFALAVLALASCGHEHIFIEMNVIKAATCTEEGEIEYTCDCGYVKKSKLEEADHVAGAWEVTKAATCVAKGSRSTSCKACGLTLDIESIPMLDHDIVKIDAKKATCSEEGHDAYEHCTLCGYTTYVERAKLDHTPGAAATCTTPQFCKVCEYPMSDALGHIREVKLGKEATCEREGLTDLVECSRCDKVIEEQITIPKREHASAVVKGYAATCSEEGLSDGAICLVCNETLIMQITIPVNNDHTYRSDSTKGCSYCSYKRDTGCKHEDEEGESTLDSLNDKNATCEKYGLTEGEICTVCGWMTMVQELVAPEAHDVKILEAVSPTYTTPGLTEGEYCKDCRQIVKQQEVIPVLNPENMVEDREEVLNGGDLAYKKNTLAKTCEITGIGTCTSKDIIIPEYIDEYLVTSIADEAFYGNTTLESVIVKKNVLTIGDKAFGACTKLTKATISDGIDVHEDAFLASSAVTVEYTHTLAYANELEASCNVPGRKAHYICINCGNRYEDKNCAKQIFNVEIKVEHEFKGESDNCTDCKQHIDKVLITKINSIDDKYKNMTVKYGTSIKDLKLPTTINATTFDGETHALSIVWDLTQYKSHAYGMYSVTGYILTGGYTIKNTKIDDEISIYISVT